VDAIESGNDDNAEAAMLTVLAQAPRDIATPIKVAMKGKESVRFHKAFRTGVNRYA
jgi:hypothetical protein